MKIWLTLLGFFTAGFGFTQEPGSVAWGVKQEGINPSSNIQSFSIVTDSQGNAFTIGSFKGTVQFQTPTTPITLSCPSGTNDPDHQFISKISSTGITQWAFDIGIYDLDFPYRMLMLSSGEIILHASFSGAKDFDLSAGNYTLSAAGRDGFIWKLSTNGDLVWVKTFQGTDVILHDVAEFNTDLYVCGSYNYTTDFDPGSGTAYLTDDNNAFLVKLNQQGDFQWVKPMHRFPPQGTTHAYDLSVNNSGVYVLGNFSGSFRPDPNNYNLVYDSGSYNKFDLYLSKLDHSGNHQYVKHFIGSNSVLPSDVQLTPDGNIFVFGGFIGTLNPDPNGTAPSLTAGGQNYNFNSNNFMIKLNSQGNYTWATVLNGYLLQRSAFNKYYGQSFHVRPDGSMVYVGKTNTGFDMDPSSNTAALNFPNYFEGTFICEYSNTGNISWLKGIEKGNTAAISVRPDGYYQMATFIFGLHDMDYSSGLYNVSTNYIANIVTKHNFATTVGVESISKQDELILYPQPNNGNFRIVGLNSQFEAIHISNLKGEVILEIDVTNLIETNCTLTLVPGLYFARVSGANQESIFLKFTIQP